MMNAPHRFALASLALAGALAATPALAGAADSPLPVLAVGGVTQHVYSVPGVIKNNNIETVFVCTSFDTAVATVAVEVFAAAGGPPLNDVWPALGDGTETLSPGGTATITTGATAGFHEDEIIDALLPASLRNGSARILSTSKKIGCTAFLTDEINDPPSGMAPLKILYKTKQRGE